MQRLGLPVVENLDEDLPEALDEIDPFLSEAANITFDLINTTKRYAYNAR